MSAYEILAMIAIAMAAAVLTQPLVELLI